MTPRGTVAWSACFVAIGLLALLVELDVWRPRADWMWPIVLMAAGVGLLVAGAVGTGRAGDGTGTRDL